MSYFVSFIEGAIRKAPPMILIDNIEVWNPTDEQLFSAGYKQAILSEKPESQEGYRYVDEWVLDENTVLQKWNSVPDDNNIEDKAEAYDILMGVEQ